MERLDDYIEEHSSSEDNALREINHTTCLQVINSHMLSGRVQGRLLSLISHMIRPQRILELGTYTGYSALCLAEGLDPQGELITIEHNDELERRIRHNLSLSPYGVRVHPVIGDAKAVIPTLSGMFDMVFIDADKREYMSYYELIFPLVRKGGFILADNTLWDGHVIDPKYDKDPQTLGLRAFNDFIRDDQRVEKVILSLRDGLTIMRKI